MTTLKKVLPILLTLLWCGPFLPAQGQGVAEGRVLNGTYPGSQLNGLSVETMSDQLLPPSVEACHLTIAPVAPVRLIVVPVPVQTSALPAVAMPPTETGAPTVSETLLELAAGVQVPLTKQT